MTILHLKRRCRLSENKHQTSNVSRKKNEYVFTYDETSSFKFSEPKIVEHSLVPKNRWEATQEGCSASPTGRDRLQGPDCETI